MSDPLSPRQHEFVDKFTRLLAEYHDVVGPVAINDDDEGTLDAQDLNDRPSLPGAQLYQWMILTSWVDMADGEPYSSAYCLPGMPTYHRRGMLLTWLDEWR